ncbi:MAG: ORF6N domain-containing protein [Bdellovibrionota bacterium]
MIYIVRGQKVMMDFDLAELYSVETKNLKKAVRRNMNRFPDDFMFEMTKEELENWRFQFGTSNRLKMGLRVQPFVFTELGVAMLSSVLNSEQAISINISVMRIFSKLKSFHFMEKGLSEKIEKLEAGTNKVFKVVFERLDSMESLVDTKLPVPKRKIGLKD